LLTDTQAGSALDASGRAVSPGFIDAHPHSDLAMFCPSGAVMRHHRGVAASACDDRLYRNSGLSPFSHTPQYSD